MQSQINEITQSTRKYFIPKLSKYNTLHNLAISIHRRYCSMTGFMHILPNYLIIGGQKCGTNSLYSYLVNHPNVRPALTKEIRFFDKYYDRGINWYKVCFPFKFDQNLNKGRIFTGEATERYLEYPHAPKRVKSVLTNVKLIILLRNPVDRAYSHYSMRFKSGKEKLSFEDAIESEHERTKGEFEKMQNNEIYYSSKYFQNSYLDRGIYVDKIKRWMDVFPKEQFLIIQSEKFLENPNKIYQTVLNFLKLPKWQLKKYELIGKFTRSPMQEKTRKKLTEFFKPHNQRLYDLLEEKFDWDN